MKFILFEPKKEMNSFPTLQDEKIAVEKFLNIKVQEAMCCLDTQEPSDRPSTTPDEVPAENISNRHDHTVDQVPHIYQASKHAHSTPLSEHSTPLSEIPTNLSCHVVQILQAKHEFLVDREASGDLAGSDVILLSIFGRKPHPLDNMDCSIDHIEISQLDPHS